MKQMHFDSTSPVVITDEANEMHAARMSDDHLIEHFPRSIDAEASKLEVRGDGVIKAVKRRLPAACGNRTVVECEAWNPPAHFPYLLSRTATQS